MRQKNNQLSIHVFAFVVRAMACPLELLFRHRFGGRYMGFPALAAMLFMPLWITLFPDRHSIGLSILWYLCLLLLLRARIQSARMIRRGLYLHSRYNGVPWLASVLRRTSERRIKAMIEPGLGLLTGYLLLSLDPALGSFLVVSAVALAMTETTIDAAEEIRAVQLNDAIIEQQSLAERVRAMRGERL